MSDKKYIRVAIKAKGSDRVFKEGFGPGVLVYHDIEIEANERPSQIALSVMGIGDALIEEYFSKEHLEITEEEFLETKKMEDEILDKTV
jgi:hypothetical protein